MINNDLQGNIIIMDRVKVFYIKTCNESDTFIF